MAWITKSDVAVLLQTDLDDDQYIDGLITQAQGLAEIEVGALDEPSAGLKAAVAQIVARMWQAGQSAKANPAGMQSQMAGPFNFQDTQGGAAGLGLTNREKNLLRKAAGKGGLWVQPTSRGDDLETPPNHRVLEDALDPIDKLAAAQTDLWRP